MTELEEAYSGAPLEQVRELFSEYADSLAISLDFQDFGAELATLPGAYSRPAGRLVLAKVEGEAAGCAALRAMDQTICEIKRLYIRPGFRGNNLGRVLARHVIDEARQIGYSRMRLDTLPSMSSARALYASLGFQSIEPYRYNPVAGTDYMELRLT